MIGGGANNSGSGPYSFIGSGYENATSDTASIVVGGVLNSVSNNYSAVVGGLNNYVASPFAFLGAGYNNMIDVGSDTSVLVGGGMNYITNSVYAAVVGGAYDTISSSAAAFIGCGALNKLASGSYYSSIVGGDSNIITGELGFIGGGCHNFVAAPFWGTVAGGCKNTVSDSLGFIGGGNHNTVAGPWATIGGGSANYIGALDSSFPHPLPANYLPPNSATIAGGRADTASGHYSSITGGFLNNAVGKYATIPGGIGLFAYDFQTVIGRFNDTTGATWLKNYASTNGLVPTPGQIYPGIDSLPPADYPIFVVGNGASPINNFSQRSNAFEVSNDGHSIVYHQLGQAVPGNPHTYPISGGTYENNTVIAWGKVDAGGNYKEGIGYSVKHGAAYDPGCYIIKIFTADSKQNSINLSGVSITATLLNNDTTGTTGMTSPGDTIPLVLNPAFEASPVCGKIVVSDIGMFAPPNQNVFLVHTYNSSCSPADEPFYFKVCGQ